MSNVSSVAGMAKAPGMLGRDLMVGSGRSLEGGALSRRGSRFEELQRTGSVRAKTQPPPLSRVGSSFNSGLDPFGSFVGSGSPGSSTATHPMTSFNGGRRRSSTPSEFGFSITSTVSFNDSEGGASGGSRRSSRDDSSLGSKDGSVGSVDVQVARTFSTRTEVYQEGLAARSRPLVSNLDPSGGDSRRSSGSVDSSNVSTVTAPGILIAPPMSLRNVMDMGEFGGEKVLRQDSGSASGSDLSDSDEQPLTPKKHSMGSEGGTPLGVSLSQTASGTTTPVSRSLAETRSMSVRSERSNVSGVSANSSPLADQSLYQLSPLVMYESPVGEGGWWGAGNIVDFRGSNRETFSRQAREDVYSFENEPPLFDVAGKYRGEETKVVRASSIEGGAQKYAVKLLGRRSINPSFINEDKKVAIRMMEVVPGNHVVHAVDVGVTEKAAVKYCMIVMPLYDGNFSQIVTGRLISEKSDLFKEVVRQSLLGLGYLHGNGIVHRDVKPANILVSINNQPGLGVQVEASLTDLGSSNKVGEERFLDVTSQDRTPEFHVKFERVIERALSGQPEAVIERAIDRNSFEICKKQDVGALGLSLEFETRRPVSQQADNDSQGGGGLAPAIINDFLDGVRDLALSRSQVASFLRETRASDEVFIQFLAKMLVGELSVEEALNDPYLIRAERAQEEV